ncbi:hypothetical protein OE88DRAFT_1736896 [Heliocybe sulcata]|uniref:Uncharacterized protein n=1 Tax=Heliocybe sulcata TaxID=5364 RepID=A0A5C3MWM0_9AGAM|nr:hypothetical protein OE88DRAFT_1736896 [Heliocybe sulcata]
MDHFSWSDSIQAVLAPCLPCFRHRADSDEGNRARPGLEGLLADVDTDNDAETMSLHSTLGDRNKRRKKKKKRSGNKSVSLFGYDLFGRPPIQLPESDDEDSVPGRRGKRTRPGQFTASSSSTLDSDAAPLDQAAIDRISAMQVQAEEEERRQKEERRARRRERKDMKKLAAALAREEASGAGEFEGFPGSGGAEHGNIPSPFRLGSSQGDSSQGFQEPVLDVPVDENLDEDEAVDFGGEFYAKPVTSNNSDRGSDSRSRTSGTLSSSGDPSRMYNHHYTSQLAPVPPGTQYHPEEFMQQGLDPLPKKKKKKSSGKSKSSRDSASSTSQSQSIPSPITAFPETHPVIAEESSAAHLSRLDIPHDASGGFPSAGLGGFRRKNSDMGVFLARRGDE